MLTSLAQQALDDSPWKEHDDVESGKKYYHNAETNETTWDMPAEYKVFNSLKGLMQYLIRCYWIECLLKLKQTYLIMVLKI